MSEPQLAVWHYRDNRRKDELVALCGQPWRDPVGLVVPCDECMAVKLERRRQANPGWRPVL